MKVVYTYTAEELSKSKALPKEHQGLYQMHQMVTSGRPLSLHGKTPIVVLYQMNDNGNHDPDGNNFELHLTVAF